MKKKIPKILGVALAFMLVVSLMAFGAPVAAADYEENDWGEWGLAATDPDTDVGPMAVAPDGTIFAAVLEDGEWMVQKSEDDGYTWDDTELDDAGDAIVDIAVSPNYDDDETVYVGCDDGTVYRLEEAGDGDVTALKTITDNEGIDASELYSLDVWTDDDDYNWILVGTDIDVFVLKDKRFEDWRDQELNEVAFEVAFAPDFDGDLIWAVTPQHGWVELGIKATGATAEWSTVEPHEGNYSVYLNSGDTGEGNEGRIVIPMPAGTTLGDIESIAWSVYAVAGYPPHVDIYLDVDEDGEVDDEDVLTAEMYYNNADEVFGLVDWCDQKVDYGTWLQTFELTSDDGYDAVDDTTLLWLSKLGGGPGDAPNGTLGQWKAGELGDAGGDDFTAGVIDGNAPVLRLEIEVDRWMIDSEAYIDDITINDWTIDLEAPGTLVTSTKSPGRWGQVVDEAILIDADDIPVGAEGADIAFPDDYDSDPDSGDCIVYVGVSARGDSLADGNVYLIEGVEGDGNADTQESNAIPLMSDNVDISSIAVSGNIGDAVILAGERDGPVVWISDDGGDSWDEADKSPTGEGFTHVLMEADVVWGGEVFDTEESMAFASTAGAESAVSRSSDGGWVYNQVGLIDTEIDAILDLGFHPDFPSDSIFLMITKDTDYGTTSLWLTENGDEDEPDYERVLCAAGSASGNFAADSLKLVEFSQDASAIYIFGDDGSAPSIWKSTDDGQTFGKHRDVKSGGDYAEIMDWVITDDDTIYAAVDSSDDADYGFYKTVNSGLSWQRADTDGAMNDICLSPDFENDETILLGGDGGEVFMSDDAGGSFDFTTTTGLDKNVFVAFDADYADEDADGYMLIYAVDNAVNGSNAIMVGEGADTDDVDWDDLDDDENELPVKGDFYGLVVSSDNALYAIANTAAYEGVYDDDEEIQIGDWTNETGVVRLLLDESDSLWEYADDELTNPEGLWLTSGSNVLWTIDGDELWVLEDTLSGQVTLDSPKNGYQSDRLETIRIAWDEMRDADEYQYKLDETSGLGLDEDGTTDDTDVNVSVMASSEYDWKVRVAPGEPWHSRWSDERTFNSALGSPPWSPTLYTPGGEWQYSGLDVELMPAFSWESAKNADSYQFVLADNAEFTSPLVNDKVPESAYNLDFELEYNSNYFWRVMAYNGNKALSRWSDIGAFTTIEKPGAPPPSPAPPATVTQPAPAPVVIPTPIPPVLLWVIVGIGAALIIAVIILIIRTRRAV